MPYKECQKCGAHLDYGERCDCKTGNKKGSVSVTQDKTQTTSNANNIITHGKENVKCKI